MATLACKKRQTKLISIGKGMPNAIFFLLSASLSLGPSLSYPSAYVCLSLLGSLLVYPCLLAAIYEPKWAQISVYTHGQCMCERFWRSIGNNFWSIFHWLTKTEQQGQRDSKTERDRQLGWEGTCVRWEFSGLSQKIRVKNYRVKWGIYFRKFSVYLVTNRA